MPGFARFRKFNDIQDSVYASTRARLLSKHPREKRKAQQMDAEGSPTPNLGTPRGRRVFWTQPTRRLAGGGYGVFIDPKLVEDIFAMVERSVPVAAEIIDEHFGRMALNARRRWPYQTGVSQALLEINAWVDGDSIHADLLSKAPYTPHIKAKKLNGRKPHEALIQRPGRRVADRIGLEITKRLADG